MDPGADRNIHFGRPDGEAVLDDVFAFGNGLQRHFMPGRDILADRKGLTACRDDAALGNGVDSYGDIIMRWIWNTFIVYSFVNSAIWALTPISAMRSK